MARPNDYPEEYTEKTFYLWYENDRKINNLLVSSLPVSGNGEVPSTATIIHWKEKNGWVERADKLDAEVSRRLDEEVINKRMAMFEKHKEMRGELIKKGMEYLNEKGITSDASAIRAIDLGITTERVSTGLAEAYVKISKMSDEQLSSQLQKLLGKKSDVVEGEFTEDDDTVSE